MSATSPEEELFLSTFQEIQLELAQVGNEEPGISDAYGWLNKVLEYNLDRNKRSTSGRLLVSWFRSLANSPQDSELKVACVLGWCVDMLQASFDMSVDFISQRSTSINGRQCWYKVDDIGVLSINDSVFTKSGMFYIIKKYTADKPYYREVLESFLETVLHRVVGQSQGLRRHSADQVDFNSFTMTNYTTMSVYTKTFNSLYLSVTCAMCMAGITDERSYSAAKEILLAVSQLAQIQEDFTNCFGDIVPHAGWGSDIKDKKCTWLICRALQLGTDEQKAALQNHFCQQSDQSVTAILDMYNSLGLEVEYRSHLDSSMPAIRQLIRSSQKGDSLSLWFRLCEALFPTAEAKTPQLLL